MWLLGGQPAEGPWPSGRLAALSLREFIVLCAAARRILLGTGLAGGGEREVALWIDGYVAGLDAALRADISTLLLALEGSPLLVGLWGRFSRLPGEQQDRVLLSWQDSGLAMRRQGFFALKSLCCLAYYQDARSFAEIGYGGLL